MRGRGVSGVAEEAEAALVICASRFVHEEGPDIRLLHRINDALDGLAPSLVVLLHIFFGGVYDPLRVFPFFA